MAKQETQRGVEAWLSPDDGRPDMFVAEDGHFGFPCCACRERFKKDIGSCWKCRHFVR